MPTKPTLVLSLGAAWSCRGPQHRAEVPHTASIPVSTPTQSATRSPPVQRCRVLPASVTSGGPGSERAAPRNSDGTLQRLATAPPSEPGFTLLFTYQDFGPPVMAHALLGDDWWSWQPGGSFELGDRFDVRVVVYQGRTLQEVQAQFPTLRGESDYRYVARDAALSYLRSNSTELAGASAPDQDWPQRLRLRLEATRNTILTCLPR